MCTLSLFSNAEFVFFANGASIVFEKVHGKSLLERFSLDCRKTKTKVNTLANQRS